MEGLLTEKEAAEWARMAPRTLQLWRQRGEGPRFVRISARCIRYRLEDLKAWAAERVRSNTVSDHEG